MKFGAKDGLIALLIGMAFLEPSVLHAQDITHSVFGAKARLENSILQIAVAIPGQPQPLITQFGTGFIVDNQGTIVTASHVYLKALDSVVDNRSGVVVARRFSHSQSGVWVAAPLKLIAQDYAHDVVILQMVAVDKQWDSVGGLAPLSLANSSQEIEDGAKVEMRGYFGSDIFTVYLTGMLAGRTSIGPEAIQELLIVMPVVPGQSGSPLIDADSGKVIGVMTAIVPVALPFNQQPAHSGLARAVEVEHVKRLLESLKK